MIVEARTSKNCNYDCTYFISVNSKLNFMTLTLIVTLKLTLILQLTLTLLLTLQLTLTLKLTLTLQLTLTLTLTLYRCNGRRSNGHSFLRSRVG